MDGFILDSSWIPLRMPRPLPFARLTSIESSWNCQSDSNSEKENSLARGTIWAAIQVEDGNDKSIATDPGGGGGEEEE